MSPNLPTSMMAVAVAKSKLLFLMLALSACLGNFSLAKEKTESIKFEIQVLGLKIGDLNVSKYQIGDTTHYIAESQVKFWFFGSVNLDINTHSKYVKGYLVKSHSRSNTNRGNFASTIRWDGKKYLVDATSYKFENQEPIYGLVEWSSNRMFFEELPDGKRFLSEVYGLTTTVKRLRPNVYQTIFLGNENQYFYQFGKLQSVEIENSIKNFNYKRIK